MSSPPTTLTAAEIVRISRSKRQKTDRSFIHKQDTKDESTQPVQTGRINIDDEIERLERELAAQPSDDSSQSSSLSPSISEDRAKTLTTRRSCEKGAEVPSKEVHDHILCLSTAANERIKPLPRHLLPMPQKRDPIKNATRKTRNHGSQQNEARSGGIESAVRQILEGYVARSSERLPFYCRVCAVQYSNEDELMSHRQTEFHVKACQIERKSSYCKLCRKQLTSPIQLKEHIRSAPHRERLEQLQSRQSSRPNMRPK
jgi:hypothetical protein